MDIDAFAALAEAEYAALPDGVRQLAGDVQIAVADEPDDETLAMMELSHPDELLGLFEGIGFTAGEADVTGRMPNRIWLYRLPILSFQATGSDTVEAVVRHVLIHEIGHHFGLSDDDMYAIDDAPD